MDLLVFYTLLATLKYVETERITLVDRCDACYYPKDAPYILHKFELRIEKHHKFYVTISTDVTMPLEAKYLEANVRLTRCASRDQLDTCEFVSVLRPPLNICTVISTAKFGFKSLFEAFTPPVKCPFFGNYSTTNLTFNFDNLKYFPLDKYYWKTVVNVVYKTRLIGSICLDFSIKEILL